MTLMLMIKVLESICFKWRASWDGQVERNYWRGRFMRGWKKTQVTRRTQTRDIHKNTLEQHLLLLLCPLHPLVSHLIPRCNLIAVVLERCAFDIRRCKFLTSHRFRVKLPLLFETTFSVSHHLIPIHIYSSSLNSPSFMLMPHQFVLASSFLIRETVVQQLYCQEVINLFCGNDLVI